MFISFIYLPEKVVTNFGVGVSPFGAYINKSQLFYIGKYKSLFRTLSYTDGTDLAAMSSFISGGNRSARRKPP